MIDDSILEIGEGWWADGFDFIGGIWRNFLELQGVMAVIGRRKNGESGSDGCCGVGGMGALMIENRGEADGYGWLGFFDGIWRNSLEFQAVTKFGYLIFCSVPDFHRFRVFDHE